MLFPQLSSFVHVKILGAQRKRLDDCMRGRSSLQRCGRRDAPECRKGRNWGWCGPYIWDIASGIFWNLTFKYVCFGAYGSLKKENFNLQSAYYLGHWPNKIIGALCWCADEELFIAECDMNISFIYSRLSTLLLWEIFTPLASDSIPWSCYNRL